MTLICEETYVREGGKEVDAVRIHKIHTVSLKRMLIRNVGGKKLQQSTYAANTIHRILKLSM